MNLVLLKLRSVSLCHNPCSRYVVVHEQFPWLEVLYELHPKWLLNSSTYAFAFLSQQINLSEQQKTAQIGSVWVSLVVIKDSYEEEFCSVHHHPCAHLPWTVSIEPVLDGSTEIQ